MAGDMNRVTLIGRLGADPEIRTLNNGSKVANFRIATSETWRDKATGERQEKTQWHQCVCWNDPLVKVIEQYVGKGDKVLVEGALETRKWQDQGGNDRYSTEVVMKAFGSQLLLLSSKRDGDEGEQSAQSAPKQSGSKPAGQRRPMSEELDDEIPF